MSESVIAIPTAAPVPVQQSASGTGAPPPTPAVLQPAVGVHAATNAVAGTSANQQFQSELARQMLGQPASGAVALPTTTPAAVPSSPTTPAAPPPIPAALPVVGPNTATNVAADTPINQQYQSELARQMLGQPAPGAVVLPKASAALVATPAASPTVPGSLPELPSPVVGAGTNPPDKPRKGGTALPPPPRDRVPRGASRRGLALPQLLPPGERGAAPPVKTAAGDGTPVASPRSNSNPIANALAQDAVTPGANTVTARTPPELFTAVASQHETVSSMHTAALAAELSAQAPALTAAATQSAALANVPALSAVPVPSAAQLSSAALPVAMPAIPIPVAQPGWDQALGQRVQWLVGQHLQGAELRITPPHLGPIEVSISIGHDQQTVVNFASPHAVVRDAIEAAAPRLRDMLGNNGQDLVNVNVSQHSFAEQRRQAAPSGGGRNNASFGGLSVAAADVSSGAPASRISGVGLVDYFA